MTSGGDALARCNPLPKRAFLHAHVHFSMTLHDAFDPFVGLFPRLGYQLSRENNSEKHGHDRNHERTAGKFGECKLPSHQHDQYDTQFGNQVSGSQFERHRGGEISALSKNRTRQRDRRVGT